MKENSEQINEIEKRLKCFESRQEKPSNDDLVKIIDMKMETLEIYMKSLEKVIEDKDLKISQLQLKLNYFEKENSEDKWGLSCAKLR